MATTTVRLNKGDSPNWGFRLQGGKDFGTPLVIQKVNGGSPAERAGLIAGDAVIRINNVDVYNLLHKEAQDVIVRAGNNFEMVIQRGGSTWKPSVVPTGTYAKPSPSINNVNPVTKTSLAANKGENIGAIGTGHNLSAKPFAPQVNGTINGGPAPKLINKQYNSPVKLYSEDAIAETISAQSEVLSTGALGVNFKKNEKNYDSSNSAVYRMLKEAENEPTTPEQAFRSDYYSSLSHAIGGRATSSPRPHTPASETLPQQTQQQTSSNTEGATICSDCERVIVGVFVRIKEKNLHVECFKCSTCGSSLKNVGYYNINNKLYCDIHAKSAAIAVNNPSAVPITVSPGGKAPASAISAALSSHTLPTPSPLSPKAASYAPSYPLAEERKEAVADSLLSTVPIAPSSLPTQISSSAPSESNILPSSNSSLYNSSVPLSFSKYINKSSNIGAPKPFSSVSAPLSPPQSNFNKAPVSPSAHSYGSYSPASTGGRSTNIIWPPPQEDTDLPTACPLFYPPPSRVEAEIKLKEKQKTNFEQEYFANEDEINLLDETMSFYSEELSFSGRKSATECVEILSETLDTQKLVENVIKTAPNVLPPLEQPERPTEYKPIECQLPSKIESKIDNIVPQKWESPLTQAIRTTKPDSDTFSLIPRKAPSPMVSALAIAPTEPFNPLPTTSLDPVPLPEMTEPYFPPEHPILPVKREDNELEKKEEKLPIPKPYSPFVKALEIAPERPFTPVGGPPSLPPVKKKPKDPLDQLLDELPKPNEKLDMRSALTTAPDRSYTPLITEYSATVTEEHTQKKINKSDLIRPLKPEDLPASFQMNKKEPKPPSYYAPAVIEERIRSETQETIEATENKETKIIEKETIEPGVQQQIIHEAPTGNFAPIFQGFSCSFKNKTDHSQFSIEVSTTPPVPTPPPKPQTPISYIATVEEKPATVTREKIIQETTGKQQTTKNVEVKEKQIVQNVQKQAEEVIQVKPMAATAILKKPESLPSYQLDLQATAEADLLLMERRKKAEQRIEQQKKEREQQQQQQQMVQEHQNIQQQAIQKKEQEQALCQRQAQQSIHRKEQQSLQRQEQQSIQRQEQQSVQKREREHALQQQQQYIQQQAIQKRESEQQAVQRQDQQTIQKREREHALQQQHMDQHHQNNQQRQYQEQAIQKRKSEQQAVQRQEQQTIQKREREHALQQQQMDQHHQNIQQRQYQQQMDQHQQNIQQRQYQQQAVQRQEQQTIQKREREHALQQQQMDQHQQNIQQQQYQQQAAKQQKVTKPIITIEPGDNIGHKFQPILDDKPASTSFSPRPRSITPSMINKAPALLPYYQDNLVPHFHAAIATNVFDPAHPEISRSPSPHPGKEPARSRSPSPFPTEIRAKSPAEGPPPNPLQKPSSLPTPQDSRVEQAKESLKSYIPEYKSKRELVELEKGADFCKRGSEDYSQNVAYQGNVHYGAVQHQIQQIHDMQRHQTETSSGIIATKEISEKTHQEHMEASSKTHSHTTEVSADGLVQVQKRKLVTEELERSHKEQNIQIATNVKTKGAFERANVGFIDIGSCQKFHITNPQHVSFKSLEEQQTCCQNQPTSCQMSCQKQPQLSSIEPPKVVPPQPPIRKVFPPGSLAPIKHVSAPSTSTSSSKPCESVNPKPDTGAGTGRQTGGITAVPKRGRGLLQTAALPGTRVPLCGQCHGQIRGPFITALGKIWCPQHFICATPSCRRPLQDLGFVEERGQLYCEYCFEQYLAPSCSKCNGKIKGDCLKAIGKNFHPECFNCVYCGKLFGNNPFFLEDGNPYCDADWNELFTTKCFACGFPVEAGDRWVEALNNNYHSQCFNCTMCKKNLEGQSFFAKGGRPFCKNHAR